MLEHIGKGNAGTLGDSGHLFDQRRRVIPQIAFHTLPDDLNPRRIVVLQIVLGILRHNPAEPGLYRLAISLAYLVGTAGDLPDLKTNRIHLILPVVLKPSGASRAPASETKSCPLQTLRSLRIRD
jgi:hypothetical protein